MPELTELVEFQIGKDSSVWTVWRRMLLREAPEYIERWQKAGYLIRLVSEGQKADASATRATDSWFAAFRKGERG